MPTSQGSWDLFPNLKLEICNLDVNVAEANLLLTLLVLDNTAKHPGTEE